MKYIDEFRDSKIAKYLIDEINRITTKEWVIMELCGGQTHTIVQHGIDQLLPKKIELVHGPGCPVCVTPLEVIDQAIEIAKLPNVIFTSFGDMLRVPGSQSDLLKLKSQGADVRIVYSPLEAVKIAKDNPEWDVYDSLVYEKYFYLPNKFIFGDINIIKNATANMFSKPLVAI